MNDIDYVTVEQLSKEFGLDRSNTRKYIISQGFSFVKVRSSINSQLMIALTPEDADAVRELRKNQGYGILNKIVQTEKGYFYVIQLIPDILEKRVKLGFATTVQTRLNVHRTSAPTAILLGSWSCKSTWERTVIDSITRVGCVNVASEVYDCEDIKALLQRCENIFALLPKSN